MLKLPKFRIVLLSGIALSLAHTLLSSRPAAQAQEAKATAPQDVSITIYNQNFGVVRETRNMTLQEGTNDIRVEDVAANIDPTSVSFTSLTSPNAVIVKEQNYQYDLIDTDTILSKSLGKEIKITQYLESGRSSELNGVLLNSPVTVVNGTTRRQNIVIKTPAGIVLSPTGQIEVKELPAGLVGKPSLLWKLDSTKGGTHKTEISYQTAGINWHCDYVAVLNKDDTRADLTSWVTIDNKSGGFYRHASLKLLAGDVHRVRPTRAYPKADTAIYASAESARAPQFKEESFAEYHLYTLQGKTTVGENETKQMSLFNAGDVPVTKLFIYEPEPQNWYPYNDSDSSQKVRIKIAATNSEQNHLGIPMPKGKVRVYKKDQDGALQFIGEDQIDHTPADEKIRLYIGDAFDLVGERKQISQTRVSATTNRMAYEISLRNRKKQDVTITCVEHSGGDWHILKSSIPFKKKDAQTFEFDVKVPAGQEILLTYEIQAKY